MRYSERDHFQTSGAKCLNPDDALYDRRPGTDECERILQSTLQSSMRITCMLTVNQPIRNGSANPCVTLNSSWPSTCIVCRDPTHTGPSADNLRTLSWLCLILQQHRWSPINLDRMIGPRMSSPNRPDVMEWGDGNTDRRTLPHYSG